MAINYNDPYNQGLGTPNLGTPNLGNMNVGNINQGQNIQTAGAWGNIMPEFMGGYSEEEMAQNAALEQIQDLRINQMKGIPQGKTEVETQSIIDDLQYTNPDKLKQYQDIEKQIQDLKRQFPQNINIQQAYLDDDEDEFSGIERQTAFFYLPELFGLLKAGTSKKKIGEYLLKNQLLNQTGKKIGPSLRRKIRQTQGEKFTGSGKFKNIATGSKDYGPYTKPPIKPYVAPPGPHSADPPSGNGGGSGSGVAAGTGASGPPGRNYKKVGGRASYFDGGLLSLWPR